MYTDTRTGWTEVTVCVESCRVTQRPAGSGRQELAGMHAAERCPGASGLALARGREGGGGYDTLARH